MQGREHGRGAVPLEDLNSLGRVVFNTVTKEFEIYLDKQLQTPQFEKQVLTCQCASLIVELKV